MIKCNKGWKAFIAFFCAIEKDKCASKLYICQYDLEMEEELC